MQRLLSWEIGPASWQEFEEGVFDDGYPKFEDADEAMNAEPEEDEPEVIQGLFSIGEKMILGGPAKAKKTWLFIDLFVAVTTAGKWLGRQCNKGRVLYVNLEQRGNKFKKRLRAVKEALGAGSLTGSKMIHLRGLNGDIVNLVDAILRRVKPGDFELIIIDPIYKTLGNRDENKAGDVTDLLNHVERLATITGGAVAIAHHFPKGFANEKQSRDMTSGSSAFIRDPDLAINLVPQKLEGNEVELDYSRFTVKTIPRERPDIADYVIKFNYPLFAVDEDGDPKATRAKAGPKQKYSALQIAELVGDVPMAHKDILEKAKNAYGASKTTINDRLKEAELLKLLGQDDNGFWISDKNAIAKAKESSGPTVFRAKQSVSPELSANCLVGIPD